MTQEYIIINKTAIQKRIEELEEKKDDPNKLKDPRDWSYVCGQLDILNYLLSQSTPLIPEIEKALKTNIPICDEHTMEEAIKITENYQTWYISNLKLDI